MSLPYGQRPPNEQERLGEPVGDPGAGLRGRQPPDDPADPGHGFPAGAHVATRRLSGMWIALSAGAVILLLLLIFILENSEDVHIAYFGVHGTLPLGVALLLAAIFGVLLVVIPGAGRILQLRREARRYRNDPAAPHRTSR